jgi:hypothetical protein
VYWDKKTTKGKSWVFMRETSMGMRKRELCVCVRECSVCERVREWVTCCYVQQQTREVKRESEACVRRGKA